MKVYALVGTSGTGKSYKAINLAKDKKIKYILDDGLLIKGTKIMAGKSAKREHSTIKAVKTALFMDEGHRKSVLNILKNDKIESILLIGTSERMVEKIAKALELPEISEKIYIDQISKKEEIAIAKNSRMKEGKHIIPVPTFEVKKDFSGYFLDTLKIFKRKGDKKEDSYEKTVVRPTFSYLGKYTISNGVLKDLIRISGYRISNISKISNVYIKDDIHGIEINIDINMDKVEAIPPLIIQLQESIIAEIEYATALNVLAVNVNVKKIINI
ncbi:hypothetical protein [Senegalia sp. (in: firmicutes)]|uniref:hypothetical protein n=1 Tax=Senegalia sp. (in: firmicutes) TaxID=1924098 RepID=UPI003F9510D2